MSGQEGRSQVIVLFDLSKLAWLFGIGFALMLADESPIAACAVAAISVAVGALLLKPLRLRTSDSGVSLGVLRRFRWEWWSAREVAAIQYAHWPRSLRGSASMRLRMVDGTTVYLPGTNGRMLWRSPNLQAGVPHGSRRLRVVRTPTLLRLISTSFDLPIETEGAEWFSPARPE